MIKQLFVNCIIISLCTILVSACWDQRLLRDHSLILAIGYDHSEDDRIMKTITFPKKTGENGGSKQSEAPEESQVISVTGNTVKDTDKKMEQKIPELFDRSKTRVIFFGEELATDGIFSTLDSVYRDLRGPLNAKIAIFKGEAKDALMLQSEQSLLTSDIYANLLESAGQAGITKNENVQIACPIILGNGKDVVLPYVSITDDGSEAIIEGVALFNGDQMTGTLNIKETSMFLVLSDQITKNTALNLKVHDTYEDQNKNFVNIAIRKNERDISFHVKDEDIRVQLKTTLEVEIDEYAANHLSDKDRVKSLSNRIEKQLNQLAEVTLNKIQTANNDGLGLGEKLKAYHHSTWEKVDWTKKYEEIPIETDFKVKIIRHGIMN